MIYTLMRKNEKIANIDISPEGVITKIGKIVAPELVPLQNSANRNGIVNWWRDRSIPIKQGKVQAMLRAKGILSNEEFLVQNLGLSLTDYYWIRPEGAILTWEQVNLFENEFKDNLLLGKIRVSDEEDVRHYTPNSSLQGNLEKTWVIDNGVRKLIKGNHSDLSLESINEVVISDSIRMQGADCARYDLIEITGKPYDFGCISPLFTSLSKELVSAYAVITSENKPNHLSMYEHFINMCEKYGMDRNYTREFLEFEIMMDFVFCNRDRHLTNISVLRDADTLKFTSMAPIYDSGKSLYVGRDVTKITTKSLLSIETIGFKDTELELMSLIQNRQLVDINKLPDVEKIKEWYLKDSLLTDERLKFVLEVYKRKADLLYQFQCGKDLKVLKFAKSTPTFLQLDSSPVQDSFQIDEDCDKSDYD